MGIVGGAGRDLDALGGHGTGFGVGIESAVEGVEGHTREAVVYKSKLHSTHRVLHTTRVYRQLQARNP